MSADTDMVDRAGWAIAKLRTGEEPRNFDMALARAALDASGIGEMVEALELMPDEIEVFRLMRDAPGNSRGVMARAVAERIESIRNAALSRARATVGNTHE